MYISKAKYSWAWIWRFAVLKMLLSYPIMGIVRKTLEVAGSSQSIGDANIVTISRYVGIFVCAILAHLHVKMMMKKSGLELSK